MTLARRDGDLIGVGEAMVEFAPVEGGLYRRGIAGDTFNTVWYLRRLLGARHTVGYLTGVGTDPASQAMVDFLEDAGIATTRIFRDPERTVGLYVIDLDGAERRFSYWRDHSAAKRLADDPVRLAAALDGAALIHVSGITLAVIEEPGRRRLFAALEEARARGAIVSFDPNVRRRLWRDVEPLRAAMAAAFRLADVALPSFDDETALWGDATPAETVARIAALGVGEIVVKNGAAAAMLWSDGAAVEVASVPVADARDTTGAGDAFGGAYLAARLCGLPALEACRFAHGVAAEVVRHPGALMPETAVARFAEDLAGRIPALG
ncbi:sugar kinase [Pinisolibacter aquiterrae]|uniref:sugar kinase n=1 Tax=Pinisolibacter aquiterrae TaxID=2815579 RepID=UPI001E4AAA0F|nr:sugar kinase [Pinisolibacter aquiterrae]